MSRTSSTSSSLGAISLPTLTAGLLAAFVGFASTFAVIVQGLTRMGASPAQAASGLAAVTIAMGLAGIALSLRFRMPISVAWSTPGAALLAATATPAGGFPEAVGAFLVCGALLTLAGLFRPLADLVRRIPGSLAAAMLAGVLTPLCLAPVKAAALSPAFALPVIAVWAVTLRFNRLYAVPAALVAAALVAVFNHGPLPGAEALRFPLLLTPPAFAPAAILGVALPLAVVTMASQNLPGFAVLKINGYEPPPGPVLTTTGLFSLAGAPFGGHAVNLAAITAALCAGPEAHPDPSKRWGAAVVAGAVYVAMGLMAGAAAALIAAAPPSIIEAVAGLALLPAFASAMRGALAEENEREAAVVTFLTAASGVSIAGVGGAFWGLIAGGAMLALARLRA
jgi:benzoate membrane transport protein